MAESINYESLYSLIDALDKNTVTSLLEDLLNDETYEKSEKECLTIQFLALKALSRFETDDYCFQTDSVWLKTAESIVGRKLDQLFFEIEELFRIDCNSTDIKGGHPAMTQMLALRVISKVLKQKFEEPQAAESGDQTSVTSTIKQQTEPSPNQSSWEFSGGESALYRAGYRTGASSRLTKSHRRKLLTSFYENFATSDIEKEYKGQIGLPRTSQRLFYMASVIAYNVRMRKANDPEKYEKAIADWESDLEFLKNNFYESGNWPST